MNKLGTKRIETERLILRPFEAEDAEAMYRNWASDPEVTKYLTWETHKSTEDSKAILSDWLAHYGEGDFFQWAIELKEIGEPVGSIGVVNFDESISAVEVGYCMSRAYWGQGIMPEALTAVMNFLFEEVSAERITAKHDVRNPKSGRVMQKVGMREVGRDIAVNHRGSVEVICYAALRRDRE
ncbi:MAG: GNAT family N-acetyltransferase [Clostridia bacterium]|nr:GNAT family N-acetyltransferase [Clostridia bacterium]